MIEVREFRLKCDKCGRTECITGDWRNVYDFDWPKGWLVITWDEMRFRAYCPTCYGEIFGDS